MRVEVFSCGHVCAWPAGTAEADPGLVLTSVQLDKFLCCTCHPSLTDCGSGCENRRTKGGRLKGVAW